MSESAQIDPRGPFSLKAAAGFGFGPNEGRAPRFDGAMRLAFPIDGGAGYAGAVLRQPDPDGSVEIELDLTDGGHAESAVAQIARVISLGPDGEQFLQIGTRDPAIGALQRAHPGQRPVLFHSPYEGAAWAIISARRPAAQASRVRTTLGERFGASFELAGQTFQAFPQPERLLECPSDFPGLNAQKVERLRGVARAAIDGELDVAHLHELGPERAYDDVQRLAGIGPFYASLIVLRASGFADAMLATAEPKVFRHAARLYGLDAAPTLDQFVQRAEAWRPFRTWVIVLIRLAGDRGTF